MRYYYSLAPTYFSDDFENDQVSFQRAWNFFLFFFGFGSKIIISEEEGRDLVTDCIDLSCLQFSPWKIFRLNKFSIDDESESGIIYPFISLSSSELENSKTSTTLISKFSFYIVSIFLNS